MGLREVSRTEFRQISGGNRASAAGGTYSTANGPVFVSASNGH